jgi:hypothetical protein
MMRSFPKVRADLTPAAPPALHLVGAIVNYAFRAIPSDCQRGGEYVLVSSSKKQNPGR